MLPPSFPLQSLRVFEACARHRNFTRAAAELAVTTTAVSQRIRDLEQRLGISLFRRHGPRLTLTGAGVGLGDAVREALMVLGDAVAACTATRPPLRVTCTPTFANRWLVPRLPDYHQQPGASAITLDISTEERRSEDVDVAIRSGIGPWPSFEGVALLPVEATPMLAPKLGTRLTHDPASLARLPLVPDERWPAWFGLAGTPDSNPAFVSAEYPTQDASAIAAINGAGAALLSPTLFADELARGALIAPFQQTLQGPEWYWLLWHRDRPAPNFVQWVQTETAAMKHRRGDRSRVSPESSFEFPVNGRTEVVAVTPAQG